MKKLNQTSKPLQLWSGRKSRKTIILGMLLLLTFGVATPSLAVEGDSTTEGTTNGQTDATANVDSGAGNSSENTQGDNPGQQEPEDRLNEQSKAKRKEIVDKMKKQAENIKKDKTYGDYSDQVAVELEMQAAAVEIMKDQKNFDMFSKWWDSNLEIQNMDKKRGRNGSEGMVGIRSDHVLQIPSCTDLLRLDSLTDRVETLAQEKANLIEKQNLWMMTPQDITIGATVVAAGWGGGATYGPIDIFGALKDRTNEVTDAAENVNTSELNMLGHSACMQEELNTIVHDTLGTISDGKVVGGTLKQAQDDLKNYQNTFFGTIGTKEQDPSTPADETKEWEIKQPGLFWKKLGDELSKLGSNISNSVSTSFDAVSASLNTITSTLNTLSTALTTHDADIKNELSTVIGSASPIGTLSTNSEGEPKIQKGYVMKQLDKDEESDYILFIEQSLLSEKIVPTLMLPEKHNGQLELVKEHVSNYIQNFKDAGFDVKQSEQFFNKGEKSMLDGDYKEAYNNFQKAYQHLGR